MGLHIKKILASQATEFLDCRNSFDIANCSTADGYYGVDEKRMEQARRLRLIRERIHRIRSQYEMARRLGVAYARYNNWERGAQTIPAEQASKLKGITPGVDLDYILEGEEGGLTVDALKKLHKKD